MRPGPFVWIFLLFFPGLFSQTLTVGSFSPVFQAKNPVISAFSTKESRIFFIHSQENGGIVNHLYDFLPSGAVYDDEIETPGTKKEKAGFEDILGGTSETFLFRSSYSKAENKNILYAHSMTPALEVKEEGKPVFELPAQKASRAGEFGINRSPSGNYFVIFGQYAREKSGNEKFRVCVLDGAAKKIWEKDHEFPYGAAEVLFNDVFISDKGTVHVIKRTDAENFSVFTLSGENAQPVEAKLDPGPGKKINNYSVAFTETGDLVVGGYYTEDKTAKDEKVNFNGNYFFRISRLDGKVLAKNTNAFTSPLKFLEIKKMICLPGNRVLLAGESVEKQSLGLEGSLGEMKIGYSCKNVYLDMMDENGKKVWSHVVEKESMSVNDGGLFGKCSVHASGEKILVVLNDEKRKYSMNNGKIPVVILINKDGSREKPFPITNSKVGGPNDINLVTCASIKISESEFLFMAGGEEGIFPVTLKLR